MKRFGAGGAVIPLPGDFVPRTAGLVPRTVAPRPLPLLLLLLPFAAGPSVAQQPAAAPMPSPAAPAPSPAATAPTLGAGIAALQAGSFADAVKILEAVTAASPKNVLAWRFLGTAYQKANDLDRAQAAYERGLALKPDAPVLLYNLGTVFALRKDADHAFEWLAKAKATKGLDMGIMETDPDLAALKSDPRYKALLPKPEDFEHPFVEDVKVVREWDGEAAGDQFGWIARDMGDVDGDVVHDVVTSAPTKTVGGANAGRVYVYSTKTGKLLWKFDGQPGDQLGTGVECAGDVDGDGVKDVVAGAPFGGKALVLSGKDGHVLFTFTAEKKADAFGQHVATAGDVDHDGRADVIIGAPANGAGGAGAGRAYVYSGKDGHLLLTLTGERAGDAFGSTVAGWSDGKRFFLMVGAPGAGPRKTGRVYVYDRLSPKPKFVVDSDETGRALGAMFISVPGDVDGDGVPDVYASDFTNAAKGPSTGRVYVHSGKDGRHLLTLTGETAGEGFGIGPAGAGDVDGDGHEDLVVGAWQYAGAAASGGRAYLYSGKDGSLLKTYTCRIPGDTFGFDAVGLGDVDRDGTLDLLVTSAWSGVHGYRSGRMFVISSGVSRPPPRK